MTAYRLSHVEHVQGDFTLRTGECRLERGEMYAVVGPNGCGKTTLLRVLALLARPARGHVLWNSLEVDYTDTRELLRLRRRIGYLMQNPYLFNMSVFDNIAYGLGIRGVVPAVIRENVGDIMRQLSLESLAGRNAHSLSGGEVQRVALARTLVLGADILLLDEPTANVDQRHVHAVEAYIRSINRQHGTTVVLTTHSRSQASRMSRNQVSIIEGEIRDVAYENVFAGMLHRGPDGLGQLAVGPDLVFAVGSGRPGSATVAIDPQDLILSREPLASSALNRFHGPVSRVEDADGSVRVFVDVGCPLCALITRRSYADLELNVGDDVWVTFKANSVNVL